MKSGMSISKHFAAMLPILSHSSKSLHAAYMQRLYRREGVHPFEDSEGSFSASIENISPLGMLTLQREDGSQRTYAFKEVRFVVPSSKERQV